MAWRATGNGQRFASRQFSSGAAVAGMAAGKGAGGRAPVGGRGGGGIAGGGNAANVGGQPGAPPRALGEAQGNGKGKGGSSRGSTKKQFVVQLLEALLDSQAQKKQPQAQPEWTCACGVANYATRPICRMCTAAWEDCPEAKEAAAWTKGGYQEVEMSKRAWKRQQRKERKAVKEEEERKAKQAAEDAKTAAAKQEQLPGNTGQGTVKGAQQFATVQQSAPGQPKGTPNSQSPFGSQKDGKPPTKDAAWPELRQTALGEKLEMEPIDNAGLQGAMEAIGRMIKGLSSPANSTRGEEALRDAVEAAKEKLKAAQTALQMAAEGLKQAEAELEKKQVENSVPPVARLAEHFLLCVGFAPHAAQEVRAAILQREKEKAVVQEANEKAKAAKPSPRRNFLNRCPLPGP